MTLPLNYYRGYVLGRRYGLSTQNAAGWLKDWLKMPALTLLLGGAIVALLYWFLTSWTDIWWLLAFGLMIVISLLLTVLAPVVLVPLFYPMKPLKDEGLKERFRKLARKAGADISDIYTLDFGSKGTGANAALMGIGRTKRVALSDTLLEQYTPQEIEVIIAHELGHHKNGDTAHAFAYQAVILFFSFLLTHLIARVFIESLNFSGIEDVAAMPLLAVIFIVISSLLVPFSNMFIRRRERQADEYALRLTGNPKAFISMMTKITDQNLDVAEPGKLIEQFMYDHPSSSSRVAHARSFMEGQAGEVTEK